MDFQQLDLSQMESEQQPSDQQAEVVEEDQTSTEFQNGRRASVRGQWGFGPHDSCCQNISTEQPNTDSHRTAMGVDDYGAHAPGIISTSRRLIKVLVSFVWQLGPGQSSTKGSFDRREQEIYERSHYVEHQPGEFHRRDSTDAWTRMSRYELEQALRDNIDNMKAKECEWEARERELQVQVSQINHHLEANTHMFQARLHESESEKALIEEKHNNFIRKQQEESFRQMESARWLPMDDGKVMDSLDRLKRDMRSWAKGTSCKDNSLFQSLGEVESAALMQILADVAQVEDGQLPEGLLTITRAPTLLLNALLAHSVYTSFFSSPFCFLGNSDTELSLNHMPESILEDVYARALEANRQEANIWRSQTLRLLLPPLRDDASSAEKELHRATEDSITQTADRQASAFLESSASHLIETKTKTDSTERLKKIYRDAAALSYKLWTRRVEIGLCTFHEIKHLAFNAESPFFDPDNLVRYDDHEDHLKDKMPTLMVHPLLLVLGTDEAEDYDKMRIWAKGVIWLDSKKS